MVYDVYRPANKIALRVPVVVLVLAQIAIPVELRPLGCATLSLSIEASDVITNIVGFVPVGIVLGGVGILRAVIVAGSMSVVGEASQFVMVHRHPSPIDVAANVIGTVMGTFISTRCRIHSPEWRVNTWSTLVAATLALVLLLIIWTSKGDALNNRGVSSPGALEAYWKLDENRGRVAWDSSGHGLHGKFPSEPKRVAGVLGGAVKFDGTKDYIDFGHASAFRLVGSMTISAWINPSSFPIDDAAIVSQFQSGYGYQLDTTVDTGPRTIGFKLTNARGDIMARYGATPLVAGNWYHVTGVYDAAARTLDVYLNGKLDNGFLLGSVTGTQHSSRSAVYVGRRSDHKGFEFSGDIDDVRIYSFALTNTDVAADMRARTIDGEATAATGPSTNRSQRMGRGGDIDTRCAMLSDPEDANVPGETAVFGALVAVAFLGLWPSAGLVVFFGISFAAGLLLVPAMAPTLPSFTLWMMPLVSLTGSSSVAVSVRRQNDPRSYGPESTSPGA